MLSNIYLYRVEYFDAKITIIKFFREKTIKNMEIFEKNFDFFSVF